MTGPRPRLLVGVVGTATDVGKTWVTAACVSALRGSGRHVVARKPAQSFTSGDTAPTDAAVLGAASGEDPETICPRHRWYAVPMAPPMAAAALGLPAPILLDLLDEIVWPESETQIGFVETVGGVRSPVATDADSRDVVRALRPDAVIVVADAGLGVIDDVRTSVESLHGLPLHIHLNRFDARDDLHQRNLVWLHEVDGIVATTDIPTLVSALLGLIDG